MNAQRGAALLTAMVLVAMVVTLMSELLFSQWKASRRYAAVLYDEQALQYGLGAEGWVKHILSDDAEDGEVDHLNEDWNQSLTLPIEGGVISGRLEDLQGKFNVNGLIDENGEPIEQQVDIFNRLLTNLEIDISLTPKILDWLDSNVEETFPDGAEDNVYSSQTPGYRTLNAAITDISELAQLKDADTKIVRALRPHVTALPAPTQLNINTLSEQAYMSLSPSHSVEDYNAYAQQRLDEPFESVDNWPSTNLDEIQGLISVQSQFFALTLDVTLGERTLRLYSVLERTANGPVIVRLRYLNPTFI